MTCISSFGWVLIATFLGIGGGWVPTKAQPPTGSNVDPKVATLVKEVRELLSGKDFFDEQEAPLIKLGESAFPAYEAIIADPKSKPKHVERTFCVIRRLETDRQRFVEPAVARLADANSAVRWTALGLLQVIGSERDTAPVVALLSDEDLMVHHTAAETLTKIGGKRDLVAMDAWLKSGTGRHRDGESLRYVKKCRDELEKRLKKHSIPKNLIN